MYNVGDKIRGIITSIDYGMTRMELLDGDTSLFCKMHLGYFRKDSARLKCGESFEGIIIGKHSKERLIVGQIEFGIKSPNNNILNEYDYALVFLNNILKEGYNRNLELDLACQCISIVKGMLNRCIKKDQSDWIIVYRSFGFHYDGKIHMYSGLIGNMSKLLREIKTGDHKYEEVEEELSALVGQLITAGFNTRVDSAYCSIHREMVSRGVEPHSIEFKEDSEVKEFPTELNGEYMVKKVNYKRLIKKAVNFHEAVQYKNEMLIHGEMLDSKIYGILINKADSREQVESIKNEMNENGVEVLSNTRNGYYKRSIQIAKSFEEANKVMETVKAKGVVPPLDVYEILLRKAEDIKDIEAIKKEMLILGYDCNSVSVSKKDEKLTVTKIMDGKGKFSVFLQKVIEDIKVYNKKITVHSKKLSYDGMIVALEMETGNFEERITVFTAEINELKKKMDATLYEDKIVYLQGIIDGLMLKRDIYNEFCSRQLF